MSISKIDTVMILMALWAAISVLNYFKIPFDQGLLDTILLALSVKGTTGNTPAV